MPYAAADILAFTPGPGLLFGLMLAAAIVGGYTAHLFHLPRVVGFLVAGILLREVLRMALAPSAGEGGGELLALDAASEPLKAINDLALGLILFMIGGVFERSKLKAAGPRILKISLVEIGLVLLLVFVGVAIVSLVTQWSRGLGQNLVLALLLAVAGIATAPAATLFVLQEYDAKGPITDAMLGLTGLNNVVCIVLFHSVFLILGALEVISTSGTLADSLWIGLVATTLGSLVLGVAFGMLISIIHAKLPLAETILVFFAVFILLGAGEKWLFENVGISFNFLLTALVIGAVFANVAIDPQKLESSLRTVGSPIFAGFFVMAGYGLHIEELRHMGWIGAVYIAARIAGKALGCRIGVRWAGGPARAEDRIGSALLCQAAVVIGLAAFVERNWDSTLAGRFSMVVLGSVVVFELIGPLLVKRCAVAAGEVKAITLLRRGGLTAEGSSILRVSLRSLARMFGWQPHHRAEESGEPMLVEHIMRTSVQFIPASATFMEVLHFIERSTYNHFPVIDTDGRFTGVIHYSDVRDVIYDPTFSQLITAVDLADPDSVAVSMDTTLTDLLDVFTEQNVGVLPVVERGESRQIVGVVEQRDLLRALHRNDPAN